MTGATWRAEIDPRTSKIVFNVAVTLAEAKRFLWRIPPSLPVLCMAPDHTDHLYGSSRARRFALNKAYPRFIYNLNFGLGMEYFRLHPELAFPKWVPLHIARAILWSKLKKGVTRYAGTFPWGDYVVWIGGTSEGETAEIYQEYPATLFYYLKIARSDEGKAKRLLKLFTQFNNDMRHFVERLGYSPAYARAEIIRINGEVFRIIVEAAFGMLGSHPELIGVKGKMEAVVYLLESYKSTLDVE